MMMMMMMMTKEGFNDNELEFQRTKIGFQPTELGFQHVGHNKAAVLTNKNEV